MLDHIEHTLHAEGGLPRERAHDVAVLAVEHAADLHGGQFVWFPAFRRDGPRLSWFEITDRDRAIVAWAKKSGEMSAATRFKVSRQAVRRTLARVGLEERAARAGGTVLDSRKDGTP